MARRRGIFPSDSSALICFSSDSCVSWAKILIKETDMSQPTTESKRLLSHVIAEWACATEIRSIFRRRRFRQRNCFGSIPSAARWVGASRKTPKILLKHYRAMAGENASSRDSSTSLGMTNKHDRAIGGPARGSKATAFVSGFKTNPVDASFLNGHMIRAMDYNDIYWKADPCHPSDLIAAPSGAL